MNATQPEVKPSGWAIFGQVIAVVAMMVATAIIRGLAFAILWGCFVQPLGVPAINVPEAIGIALVAGLLAQRAEDAEKKGVPFWDRFIPAFSFGLTSAAVALLLGLIAHLFA